jgi:hypothetical protein
LSLLEPSSEEKEAAAKFLPLKDDATEQAESDDATSPAEQETPSEEIPDEVAKATEREGEEEAPDADDSDQKPTGLEKRIAQLTKQRRDAERELAVIRARDQQRDKELREMREQMAALTKEPDPQLSEDASPEEISAFYATRYERDRQEMEQRLQAQLQEQQVSAMTKIAEKLHPGGDNEPSFAELRAEYEQLILHDPRYEHTKAKIQTSSDPHEEFWNLARDMWKQDHKDEFDAADSLERDRDAARVSGGGGGTRSRANGRTKLSSEEVSELKKWLPDADPNKIAKRRAEGR